MVLLSIVFVMLSRATKWMMQVRIASKDNHLNRHFPVN